MAISAGAEDQRTWTPFNTVQSLDRNVACAMLGWNREAQGPTEF